MNTEINNLPALVSSIPTKDSLIATLDANKTSVTNAVIYGQGLVEQAKKGMTDELDEKLNNYLVKLKTTHKKMNDARSPLTRALDSVIKEFTGLENQIAPGKGIYAEAQAFRDGHARAKELKRKEDEAKILHNQNVAREKESVVIDVRSAIDQTIINLISADKALLNKAFEGVTLEKYDALLQAFKGYEFIFKIDRWNSILPTPDVLYLTQAEVENIILNQKAGRFQDVSKNYTAQMKAFRDELLIQFPSKKAELEAIASAGVEEASRLQKEVEERQKLAEQQRQKEAEEARTKAEEETRVAREIAEANVAMDAEIARAEIQSDNVASIRKAVKIEVLSPAGWLEIISLYFRKEGNSLGVEDLGKKKLDTMKTFAEKCARSGEFIESKNIRYVDDVKAIASKAA